MASCSWEATDHVAFEQCWLWIQGEIGFSVGSAASLTSNDVVLCTLAAPAVITCAGKYADPCFGYPSAYRFQLYKCLSSSSLQPFYPDTNKYILIPCRVRSVRSTMKKAVHRLLRLCANTLRFRDRQNLNKTKKTHWRIREREHHLWVWCSSLI